MAGAVFESSVDVFNESQLEYVKDAASKAGCEAEWDGYCTVKVRGSKEQIDAFVEEYN
jgi:hypothetical protein